MSDAPEPSQPTPENNSIQTAPSSSASAPETVPSQLQPNNTPSEWGKGGVLTGSHTVEVAEPLLTKSNGRYIFSKRLKIIIWVAVGLVVAGLISLAVLSFTYSRPINALHHSFIRLIQADAYTVDANMQVSIQGQPSMSIDVTSFVNDSLQSSGDASVSINNNGKMNTVDGKYILAGYSSVYIRPDGLKDFVAEAGSGETVLTDTLKEFDPVVGSIDKKWIEVTIDDINVLLEQELKESQMKCVYSALANYKVSYAEHDELKALLDNANAFTIVNSTIVWTDKGPAHKLSLKTKEKEADALADSIADSAIVKRITQCLPQNVGSAFTDGLNDIVTNKSDKTTIDYWVHTITHDPIKLRYEVNEGDKKTVYTIDVSNSPNTVVTAPKKEIALKEFQAEVEKFFGTTIADLQAKTRDAERQNDAAEVAKALEKYYADKGSYLSPSDITDKSMASKLQIPDEYTQAPGDTKFAFYTATEAVVQSPVFSRYVYQPLTEDGKICSGGTSCQKFIIWYRLESDRSIRKITSYN